VSWNRSESCKISFFLSRSKRAVRLIRNLKRILVYD
jgi:hypothetical protein